MGENAACTPMSGGLTGRIEVAAELPTSASAAEAATTIATAATDNHARLPSARGCLGMRIA